MKLVATVALIAAVLLLAYAALVRPHRHPMMIDAAYPTNDAQANHLIAPCPLSPKHRPILPDRRV